MRRGCILPVWNLYLLLSLLLPTVPHIKEHCDGQNREWNNGTYNAYRICGVRFSYHSKSRCRDIPPTIAPTFVPPFESLSVLLESFVGFG